MVDWILCFPTTRIHHLDSFHSDHRSVLLCMDLKIKQFYRKCRPFYFKAMWLKDSSFETVIQNCEGMELEFIWVCSKYYDQEP